VTSTAESLSGPWAANLPGWVVSTALASLVAVTQELVTPLPGAGWVVLSVLAQLVASTLWAAAVAEISRRRFGRVVPVASALLWTGLGVARGITGGIVAAAAGLDPEWLYRIGFWTVVSLCWMPLLTYALAQWDEHRRLLALRAGLAESLGTAAERAEESADDRSRRMTRAVDDALGPALDEIRAALRDNSSLGESGVGAITDRLEALAERTARFSASPAPFVPSRATAKVSVAAAAREFQLRRPVFAALLAAAASAPLVIPEALRDGGPWDLAEFAAAIVVSTVALVGLYAGVRPFLFAGALRSAATRVGVLAAGVLGAAVVVLLPWAPLDPGDYARLAVFPLVFWFATAATGTAVALNATNVELAEHARADEEALSGVLARVRAVERETASRLETLVRGEVNGRVASCVLALGLLADDGMPPDARERLIAGVLEQLDAAAGELRTG
jgi:hypothetical protein